MFPWEERYFYLSGLKMWILKEPNHILLALVSLEVPHEEIGKSGKQKVLVRCVIQWVSWGTPSQQCKADLFLPHLRGRRCPLRSLVVYQLLLSNSLIRKLFFSFRGKEWKKAGREIKRAGLANPSIWEVGYSITQFKS